MSRVTHLKKGDQAGHKNSTGRGNQLFKEQAQPTFGSAPELLLDFTKYLTSAKMRRYMERAGGASPEDRQRFLQAHLEERIGKELTNYRGKAYRVLCVYPDSEEVNVVPLWNTILTRTDFDLSITADSPAIPDILEKIDKSNHPRISVGVTITTESGGTWNDKSLSALSQLQVCGINAFPKFVPQTPPKDWEKSLQKATSHFDLGKCERIWGCTASLVASSKKGVASPKELDFAKDQLAQGFYAALEKIAGDRLQFQHHPPRRFQADWERRLLSSKATDSFGLLLNYLPVPEACDEKALKDLHDKVMREDSSKIESYTAMYEIYQMTLADSKGDEKMASRRFIKLCEVVWNRSRTQVTRNLAAGKFVRQLKETEGDLPLPEKEYHVRCICKLPEENRIACWSEIHQEIIRSPEDRKSILERVERYAADKKIPFSVKTKPSPKPSPESEILTRVEALVKDVSQVFGEESGMFKALEHFQKLVTAKANASCDEVKPKVEKEPLEQAPPLPADHSLEASLVSLHDGIAVDQTVPIGTKQVSEEETHLLKQPATPAQAGPLAPRDETNPLLALAQDMVPDFIEQILLPEPELPQKGTDPMSLEEDANGFG